MIVLVHGAWHDSSTWGELAAGLRGAGQVVLAVDLPIEDAGLGAEAYARVVVDALEPHARAAATSAEPLVLVGHSLGGLVVPVVAQLLGRDRVAGMVLVTPLLPAPGRAHRELAEAGDVYVLGQGQVRLAPGVTGWDPTVAEAVLYRGVADELVETGSASPEAARARVRRAVGRLRAQAWTIDREVTPLRAWPDVPTTVVVGMDDQVLSAQSIRERSRSIPGATTVDLPGGHFPMLTRPSGLAGIILRTAGPPEPRVSP